MTSRALQARACPLVLGLALLSAACGLWSGYKSRRKEAWETAPLAAGQIEKVRLQQRAGLCIDRVRFYSAELREPRFFLAIVPQGGPQVEHVFLLNHGWWDRPEDLLLHLKVDQVYGNLLAAHKVCPAVVALPDIRFPDYYRRNRHKFPFPHYLALVAEEAAQVISREYGPPYAREKWSIGGFSFGGYVALDVVRRCSGRFGSASIISTFHEPVWSFWPATLPPPGPMDARGRGLHTVVVPGPVPRLFLACGAQDRAYSEMVALHTRLDGLGIPHTWSTARGGHTWEYWSSVLETMLIFGLAPPPPRPAAESSPVPRLPPAGHRPATSEPPLERSTPP